MANILVITHGKLARDFVEIAETITGQMEKVLPVCFDLQENPEEFALKVKTTIKSLPPDQPTIILTDLFGGTPSNVTIPFVQKDKVEVITGLNLAMLIYLLNQPDNKSFEEICRGTRQAGSDAILIAGEFLE